MTSNARGKKAAVGPISGARSWRGTEKPRWPKRSRDSGTSLATGVIASPVVTPAPSADQHPSLPSAPPDGHPSGSQGVTHDARDISVVGGGWSNCRIPRLARGGNRVWSARGHHHRGGRCVPRRVDLPLARVACAVLGTCRDGRRRVRRSTSPDGRVSGVETPPSLMFNSAPKRTPMSPERDDGAVRLVHERETHEVLAAYPRGVRGSGSRPHRG